MYTDSFGFDVNDSVFALPKALFEKGEQTPARNADNVIYLDPATTAGSLAECQYYCDSYSNSTVTTA